VAHRDHQLKPMTQIAALARRHPLIDASALAWLTPVACRLLAIRHGPDDQIAPATHSAIRFPLIPEESRRRSAARMDQSQCAWPAPRESH
jgi:hypothetical protein